MRPSEYFGFPLPSGARFVAFRRGSKARAAHRYADGGALPFDQVFRDYPASRYHYALYLPSTDFVVVDLDTKRNPNIREDLTEWMASRGVPKWTNATFVVQTPSGGWHIYFRKPPEFPRGRWINLLASHGIEGVDVLSDGVVFLPGAEVGGRKYATLNAHKFPPMELLSTLPAPLVEAVGAASEVKNGYDESRSATPTDETLQRHGLLDTALVVAFLRSRGVSVVARGDRISACCPYHDDRSPSLSVRVRPDKLLVHCFVCDAQEPGSTYRRFVEDYQQWALSSDENAPGAWKLPTLADLFEAVKHRPRRNGVWGHLFRQGTLTMLGGYQRDFKSTLMKNVMAAVSSGRSLHGWPTQSGVCLLIDYEEPMEYIVDRFTHLDADPQRVVVISREPLTPDGPTVFDLEEDPLRVLEEWIDQYRPVLVVMDTAWNFVSAWKSYYHRTNRYASRYSATPTNEEIHYLFSRIKSLAERYNTAVVFIWHRKKGDDMGKDALSGVRALTASADSTILMQRTEQHRATVKLVAEGRHPTLICDFEFDEISGRLIEPVSESVSSSPRQDRGTGTWEPETMTASSLTKATDDSTPISGPPDRSVVDGSSAPSFTNGGLYHGQMSEEYTTMPKLEPMGWYKFQTRINHATVVSLDLPAERKGDRAPYYVGLAPTREWREKGVYGCTIGWAIQGKSCYSGLGLDDIPRLVFDIECESVDPKRSRVIGIGIRYFAPGQEHPIAETRVLDPSERTDDHERGLIEWLNDRLHAIDPLWVGGYNLFGFDIPFLMTRAEQLGARFDWLTTHFYRRHIKYRYGSNEKDVDAWFARHDPRRAVIDAFLLALRMDVASGGQLPNHKLYTVYEHLFGEQIAFDGKSLMAQWDRDQVEFLLETDVACADMVMMRLISVEFALSEYVPLPFSELIYSGQGVRAETVLIADYIRRRRAIRAETIHAPQEGYRGAISEAVRTGVFEPVAKIDVVSLYPSIIIDESLAPRNDYDGRLPILLKEMRDVRVRLKKQQDPVSQLRQQALKILINSAYGFMGADGFIFSDPQKAARVAERGRETILLMKAVLDVTGNIPLELDTDGILFVPSGDVERAVEMLRERTPFEYDVEYYQRGMILAAKSYVLVDQRGKYVVKGASLRSRREPRVAQRLLRDIVERILNRQDLHPVVESYFRAVDEAQSPEDLVRVQVYSGKTAMTDGSSPRKGDLVYSWWSREDGRLQTTSQLPPLEAIDKSAVKSYAAQLIARFDAIPEVREFLARYGGAKQFVAMFTGGQQSLDMPP